MSCSPFNRTELVTKLKSTLWQAALHSLGTSRAVLQEVQTQEDSMAIYLSLYNYHLTYVICWCC